MDKRVEAMTKRELIEEAKRRGATRLSRAALDAKPVAEIRKIVQDDERD